ncbi:hypothetical protein V8E54_006657 [Elaphomyces granulatus]
MKSGIKCHRKRWPFLRLTDYKGIPSSSIPSSPFIHPHTLARNSPRVTISTTTTAGSSASATNVTTDVSTEPSILQIQDNGNDPEEEGGDDFVDIDDMLLDELEVYRQHG